MRQIALFGVRSPIVVEYEETCHRSQIAIPFVVSVSDRPRTTIDSVISLGDLKPSHFQTPCIVCAFSPARRQALSDQARRAGLTIADPLIDPYATIASSVRVGAGSYLNAGCIIGAQSILGDHVLFNRSSSAGHHSLLADFVSVGPGVTLAGNVRIGEGSVIGAGSVVLPDVRIGKQVVVAAGSVVRRNVPDGVFVAGNPAMERPFNIARSSLNLLDAE